MHDGPTLLVPGDVHRPLADVVGPLLVDPTHQQEVTDFKQVVHNGPVQGCVSLVVGSVPVGAGVFQEQLDNLVSAVESTRTGRRR